MFFCFIVVGSVIAKKFGGVNYFGEVTAIDEHYHVVFDDGDGKSFVLYLFFFCVVFILLRNMGNTARASKRC